MEHEIAVYDFTVMFKHAIDTFGIILSDESEKLNVSVAEAQVMLFLSTAPGIDTAAELSKLRGVSKAYVSRVVAPLVDKGYITVTKDKFDRRVQHLAITDKAKGIVDELINLQKKYVNTLLCGVTDEERKISHGLIEKIDNNIIRLRKEYKEKRSK